MENQREIPINGKQLIVKKIPLIKYPQLIEIAKSLFAHKDLLSDTSSAGLINALPAMVTVAAPELVNLMVVITGQPTEEVENWGGDDFIRVVEASLEINDYQYIYSTLKKAMTSVQKKYPEAIQTALDANEEAQKAIGVPSESQS